MPATIHIYFMQRAIKFLAIFLLLGSCTSRTDHNAEKINTSKILETSLTYLLDHVHLVKEYYNQPLQIIQNKKYPINGVLKIKGRTSLILPDTTNVYALKRKMDVFKPIPIVEVIEIKSINEQFLTIDLIFRSTGHAFLLKLKKIGDEKYVVVDFSESTV